MIASRISRMAWAIGGFRSGASRIARVRTRKEGFEGMPPAKKKGGSRFMANVRYAIDFGRSDHGA